MTEREAFAHAIMAWAHENQIGDETPYPKVTTHALAYKLEELVPSFDYYGYIGKIRATLLRSEIEKLEEEKLWEYDFQGKRSMVKKNWNDAITSIITRYKEELKELTLEYE